MKLIVMKVMSQGGVYILPDPGSLKSFWIELKAKMTIYIVSNLENNEDHDDEPFWRNRKGKNQNNRAFNIGLQRMKSPL